MNTIVKESMYKSREMVRSKRQAQGMSILQPLIIKSF